MNIQCPTCNKPHALFWRVGVKDRDLVYRCNRVEKFRDTDMMDQNGRPRVETYYGTGTIAVIDSALLAKAEIAQLPEEWTAAKRQAEQNKNQHQLVLMKRKEDRP